MNSNLVAGRSRWIMLLAALALVACGGGEPAEEGTEDSGIAAVADAPEDNGSADAPTAGESAASVAPGVVIQAQTVDASPLIAELIRAEREDGVLTIQVRVRNPGAEEAYHSFETDHGRYDDWYVTAGDQKYFILKDTEGAPLAPKYFNPNIGPGIASTWWGKFPAPPASETEIDFVMPDVTPFEDVTITEG